MLMLASFQTLSILVRMMMLLNWNNQKWMMVIFVMKMMAMLRMSGNYCY